MTSSAFLTIQRDPNVEVNASDMNMIVTALFARPEIRTAAGCVPVCLPGIADDGFLHMTVKYVTPNLIVIFVTLSPDDYPRCLAKANDIAQKLEQLEIVKEITRAVRENYVACEPILKSGSTTNFSHGMIDPEQSIVVAIVRDNVYNQVCTYNLPFFSLTKGMRRKLQIMEDAYEKATEPGAHKTEFGYIKTTINEKSCVSMGGGKTIVMLANINVPSKTMFRTAEAIRERISRDENSFFVTSYLSETPP